MGTRKERVKAGEVPAEKERARRRSEAVRLLKGCLDAK